MNDSGIQGAGGKELTVTKNKKIPDRRAMEKMASDLRRLLERRGC